MNKTPYKNVDIYNIDSYVLFTTTQEIGYITQLMAD